MKILNTSVLFAASLTIGCAAGGNVIEAAPSSPLTKTEINALLVGNTFPFSNGGMYFESETEATVSWDGKTENTNWYATDNSEFCYTVELFGGNEECLGLKKLASGDYAREFEGNTTTVKASDIKPGNAL